MEFLLEEEKKGGWVKASDKNIETYSTVFDAYVSGSLKGFILFYEDKAVAMRGEVPGRLFELNIDNVAEAWGVYVDPKYRGQGIGRLLYEHSTIELKNLEFEHLMGMARIENKKVINLGESINWKPIFQIHLLKLE